MLAGRVDRRHDDDLHRLCWLTLHIAHGNAVVLSTLVAAQFLPMLFFSRRAGTIVALMVVIGAAVQLFAVSAIVYVQKSAPEAQRGHALSAYNAGFMGFVPAGSFVVAGLASIAGTRWALIGPAAVILACGAAMLAAEKSRGVVSGRDPAETSAGAA